MEKNNAVNLQKSEWILILLMRRSLDRIHIMKSIFLIWNRSGRDIRNYFHFEPYLYGPYSLEVYSELRNLQNQGLIVYPPSPIQQWSKYHLTIQGRKRLKR